jgi:hypothetical protein
VISLFLLTALALDLDSIKAEPMLEKRALRAADAALEAVANSRKAYSAGDLKPFADGVADATAAVDLALESLEAMGKHPSRNVRNYKAVETKIRELQRRVSTFRADVSFEDRAPVEKLEQHVNAAHEKLVTGIMSRKPK